MTGPLKHRTVSGDGVEKSGGEVLLGLQIPEKSSGFIPAVEAIGLKSRRYDLLLYKKVGFVCGMQNGLSWGQEWREL